MQPSLFGQQTIQGTNAIDERLTICEFLDFSEESGLAPIDSHGHRLSDLKAVAGTAERFALTHGFRFFSLFYRFQIRPGEVTEDTLTNIPEPCLTAHQQLTTAGNAPVLRRCRTTMVPFTWSDLRLRCPNDSARFEFAASHGLVDALCIPIHGVKGLFGLCCLVSPEAPTSLAAAPPALLFATCLLSTVRTILCSEGPTNTVDLLTPRQREILFLVAQGLSRKQIARQLGIDSRTVETTLARAISKLGATSREQAIVRAIECGEL